MKKPATWAGCEGVLVTDDQFWRIALTSSIAPLVWHVLPRKVDAYLSRRKAECGRGLAERIGYWLGAFWSRCKDRR